MVILASQSPRRRELLRYIFSDFTVITADCDEGSNIADPAARATEIAVRKARLARQNASENDLIIAADTLVVCSGEILGKPVDKRDAKRMLTMLSNSVCEVFTGVGVCLGGQVWGMCERTEVEFYELSPAQIDGYIATGEPMDKAGAFGAQERGALLIRRINGDFYNVMGLPVAALYRFLVRENVLKKNGALEALTERHWE